MLAELQLTMFGAPQLCRGAQNLTDKITGKALALCAYLAVTGRVHTRDVLADLLWSELSQQQARSNLRYLLSDLRPLLGDYLTITAQQVGFNTQQPYWLDVAVLRQAVKTKESRTPTATLQAALELYQGEFLAGFVVRNAPVFEEWVTTERSALHQLAVQGFYRLAEEYWREQKFNAGLAATQRLLQLEPWHEAGHRLRMLLFVQAGQRVAALTQFGECQQVLIAELGVEPEAATVALYEQIRTGAYEQLQHALANPITALSAPQPVGATYNPAPQPMIHLPPPVQADPPQLAGPSVRHNLPSQLTLFIGRQPEVRQLCALLAETDQRLVTLTGLGGIGKTRLALAVGQALLLARTPQPPPAQLAAPPAPAFPDGVWFVPLLGISPGENLASRLAVAIANAIQLPRSGAIASAEQLLADLRNRQLLLILDNFEHLADEADFVLALLQQTTQVKLLITSRCLLNLQAEFVWKLDGLTTPTLTAGLTMTPSELQEYDSIRLLVERAKRANRTFQLDRTNQADILHICHFVEGLPLGLELAAAMTRHANCHELWQAMRLDYTVLSTSLRDLPARHHTLKAMLDSSWRLLTPAQGRLLAACTIFPQAFSLEAAVAVADTTLEQLLRLSDHSLLKQTEAGRFELHEIVRQYARQLADDLCAEQQRQRYIAYYSSLIEPDASELLRSPAKLRLVQQELPNLRLVLTWCIEQQQLAPLVRISEGMFLHFLAQGSMQEGWNWLSAVIKMLRSLPTLSPSSPARRFLGLSLAAQAYLGYYLGHYAEAIQLAQAAIPIAQAFHDNRTLAMAYGMMGMVAFAQGEFAEHEERCQTALAYARSSQAPYLMVVTLAYLGLGLAIQNRLAEALTALEESLQLVHEQRLAVLEGYILSELSFVYAMTGDWALADDTTRAALQISEALDNTLYRGYQYARLALAAEAIGEYARAVAWTDQALAFDQLNPDPQNRLDVLLIRGRALRLLGDLPGAEQALIQLIVLMQTLPRPEVWAKAQIELGHIAHARRAWPVAEIYYYGALEMATAAALPCQSAAQAGLARSYFYQKQLAKSVAWAEQAVAQLLNQPLELHYGAVATALVCYYALEAAQDPRAQISLTRAWNWVETEAAKISDTTLRRSFLENVPCHQQLLTLIKATRETSPLPLERASQQPAHKQFAQGQIDHNRG